MARPYSVDLRERVLQAHEASEGSQRVLAERFAVSVGTVCGWLGLARREGRRVPRAHGRGRRPLGGADPQVLTGLVAEQNDATWRNIAPAWPSAPGCGSARRQSAGL
jgi:transposase